MDDARENQHSCGGRYGAVVWLPAGPHGDAQLFERSRRALRARRSGADPKPPQAAAVKSRGGEHCGKVGTMIPAGTVEGGECKRTARFWERPEVKVLRATRQSSARRASAARCGQIRVLLKHP